MARTSILTPGQRRLIKVVLVPAGFLMANAAYLWLSPPEESVLPTFYQWMLILHVVVGIAILVPMAWFVVWHLRRAFAMKNPRANVSGILVTVCAFALLFTGLFIFTRANSEANRWAFVSHQVLALVVPVGYVFHRMVARHAPKRRVLLTGFAAPVLLLAGMLAVHWSTLPDPRPPMQEFVPRPPRGQDPYKDRFDEWGPGGADPASVFHPASTTTQTGGFLDSDFLVNDDRPVQADLDRDIEQFGFAVNARLGSETCARCHPDTVEQWARSAHRYASFNNPFYRASIERLREEEGGRKRSQWCAGCHDPAIMMAGNMLEDIDPHIAESQAGLTCLVCHAMDEVHGVGGNGNYRIADLYPDPYLFSDAKSGWKARVNELLVRSKPDVHKRDMLKPVFRTPEYCAVCHKVSLDVPVNGYRWLRGQDEYDNHQDSGVSHNNARTFYLPPSPQDCRDCHMPLVDAPLGDMAAKDGKIRSHLFNGPNTALPFIRGDHETVAEQEAFLEGRIRADVFAVKRDGGRVHSGPDVRDIPLAAGERVEVQVVVRNQGVGHTFPGGTTDSNEAWVHFTVYDEDTPDVVLLESGRIDPETRHVDGSAHVYRSLFVNRDGQEMFRRDAQHFHALVHKNLIGPGTADVARYAFRVPPQTAGRRLVVRAAVRWRKFNRRYTEFTWETTMPGRPVPDLPVTDLAVSKAVFPVVAGVAPDPAPLPPQVVSAQWVRWNDWGIGLLLDGDTVGAERAFTLIRDSDRDRPDGWVNLARTKLTVGSNKKALELLREAEKLTPRDARLAYFFGKALEKEGRLDEAVKAFERCRKTFPGDRTVHRALGSIRYRLGFFEEALADFLEVLAIDPEDRDAHYNRFLLYSAMGDETAAAEARKAYRKYQIDDNAQEWTQAFRRENPRVNLESQPIHVHELGPRE